MITTITLNPSIDKSYILDEFYINGAFRPREFHETAGGKGLNVAKVVKLLGEEVLATGFLGGRNGQFIENEIDKLGLASDFIKIEGETRCCTAILSGDSSQTEILELGPYISEEKLKIFYNKFNEILKSSKIITASGSLPVNIPFDIYRSLITRARESGAIFLLDASGKALEEGIKAAPFLIKPNIDELETLTGAKMKDEGDIVDAAKWLCSFGINIVVISLGDKGAIIISDGKAFKIKVPKITAVNPVGSGDSMIAGFAVGLYRGYGYEEIFKLASACGTANAMEGETGKINIDNVKSIMNSVEICVL